MTSLIFLENKDPLSKERLDQIKTQIAEKLKSRCLKAYLFGSTAKDTYHTESDVDLLIIKDTDLKFTKRNIEFSDLLDIFPMIDIIVYTQEEFENSEHIPSDIKNNLLQIV